MSKWKQQTEIAKEQKEKQKDAKSALGRFFLDLAKLVFTAMVLVAAVSIIIDETKVQHWVLLGMGLIATYFLASMGYNILKR